MHMLYEKSTFRIYKGGVGGYPSRSRRSFIKSNKMEAFPLFYFFAFWQGSLDLQNYELAPQLP